MKRLLPLGILLLATSRASAGGVWPFSREDIDDTKAAVVPLASTFFGPVGGLLADHSLELLLGGWMVQRKLGEKKRHERAIRTKVKAPAVEETKAVASS